MYTCINHCTAVRSTGSLLTDGCVCASHSSCRTWAVQCREYDYTRVSVFAVMQDLRS